MIRSSSDVSNIPITNGLSASICLADATLFIKTMQNGNPSMIGYKLIPLDNQISNSQNTQNNSQIIKESSEQINIENKIVKFLTSIEERLSNLEKSLLNKQGDAEKWQI
jgi:hypothetical protein